MFNFLHNLFIPHSRNNHRAKLLHNSSLFVLMVFFLFLSFGANFIKGQNPQVLGIAYSIADDRLLFLTNKVRAENGLAPVVLNEKLTAAAKLKAEDMFKKDYWAHFAPDGATPWDFIKTAGYKYAYAGENLAKGFTSSEDAENAWLASSSHRENILSDRYKDVGFAVLQGKLQGEETVLIVELFGSQNRIISNIKEPISNKNVEISDNNLLSQRPVLAKESFYAKTFTIKPWLDLVKTSKTLIISVLFVVFSTLLVDFIIVEKKKIPRLVGHNLDHVMLIALFILFIILRKTGIIF